MNARTDLGDGKEIYDYRYDSRSGSTMVWTGRYKGPVKASDILKHFGSGTFGHRGPTMTGNADGGHFSFTQLTD